MTNLISVLTPTVRGEGLKLVEKALSRQTLDFEWLIGSKVNPQIKSAIWVEDDFKGGVWSLNRIYNKMIKKSKGSLIVSWQDYTSCKPDTLEKFAFHFKNEPKTLITAVGNKYSDDKWIVKTWQDPRQREDQGTFYPCYSSDIEFNLASIPRQAFIDVGGFDEDLDYIGYGMDGFSVADRLNLLGGWDFKIDQTIKSFSLEHGRLSKDWDKLNVLGEKYNKRRDLYLANPHLAFL